MNDSIVFIYIIYLSTGEGEAPQITKKLQFIKSQINGIFEESDSAGMTITATGSIPLTYTWEKDGTVVGDNTNYYIISKAQISDTAIYRCIVSNQFGSVRSLPLNLRVKGNALSMTSFIYL